MSIALQRQGRMPEIQRCRALELGIIGGAAFVPASAVLPRKEDVADDELSDREYSPSPASSSSASSSIGNNSDACGVREEEEDENEVQSSLRARTSLDLDGLEQSLPDSDWRKGLSKCYVGKAKSFSDLGTAESITNITELEKTEHAVNKRRRNEIALAHVWDRSCGGGISKRAITSCRSAISLAMAAMEDGGGGTSEGSGSSSPSSSRSPNFRNNRLHHHHHPKHLPPLYPGVGGGKSSHVCFAALPSPPTTQQQQRSTPMRSFSMADLHYYSPANFH